MREQLKKSAAWLSPSTPTGRTVEDAGRSKRSAWEAMHAPSLDGPSRRRHPATASNPVHHVTVGPGAGSRTASTEGAVPCLLHPRRRTYVIDTSVLLSDPQALRRFAEHEVVFRWS